MSKYDSICTYYLDAYTTDSRFRTVTISLCYGLLVLEIAFCCVLIRQFYLNGKSKMTSFAKKMLAFLLLSTFLSKTYQITFFRLRLFDNLPFSGKSVKRTNICSSDWVWGLFSRTQTNKLRLEHVPVACCTYDSS
jgi:hypothetical protein